MITGLIFCLMAANQAVTDAPAPPIGTSLAFQNQYRAALALCDGKHGPDAVAATGRLPAEGLRVKYDDSAVGPSLKPAFRQAFEEAVKLWTDAGESITESDDPDLLIDYSPDLPDDPEFKIPKGSVQLYNEGLSGPRMESVIGLTREKPRQAIRHYEVVSEVAYAIGASLGIADAPAFGPAMYKSDYLAGFQPHVAPFESRTRKAVVEACDTLRKAAAGGFALRATSPSAQFETLNYEGAPIEQGKPYEFSLLLTNTGNAPLHFMAVPDCACFSVEAPPVIQPGKSSVVRISSATQGFYGRVRKTILFLTDDPDHATQTFHFTGFIRPVLRLVSTTGDAPLPASGNQTEAKLVVYAPDGRDFKILDTRLDGLPGKVSVTPWTGVVSDPPLDPFPDATGHVALENRKGYLVTATVDVSSVSRKAPITVALKTDQTGAPVVSQALYVQKGIVAEPEEVYLGRIGKVERALSARLTSTRSSFHVVEVTCTDKSISVTTQQVSPREVALNILFNGKADFGSFEADIAVTTDDPEQSTVHIPVKGMIK